MKISLIPLTAEEIIFLKNNNALYILDFRAASESLDYDIPALWKYENLSPWILKDMKILVNEYASQLTYANHNHLIFVPTGEVAKTCILERAIHASLLPAFSELYTFIPHPAIDYFAATHDLPLNYTYDDFLCLNNKLSQKRVVKNTPAREFIESKEHLTKISNSHNFFIKRTSGSGGHTVFSLDQALHTKEFQVLFDNKSEGERYIEQKVMGESMSIQICKTGDTCTIFGLCQHVIKNEKHFYGGKFLPLQEIEKDDFLKEKLFESIHNLCDHLLETYEGFFGIDFIYNKATKTFGFLEGNIRLTAMTIPTLLFNKDTTKYSRFGEDIDQKDLNVNDFILGYDATYHCYDILSAK